MSSSTFTLYEGLARTLEFEFVHPRTNDIQFVTNSMVEYLIIAFIAASLAAIAVFKWREKAK